MSNLVQLTHPRQVREQASLWILRLEEGLTEAERTELESWLKADPAHAQALLRMAELWDAFDALAELSEIVPLHQRNRTRTKQLALRLAAATGCIAVLAASLYLALSRDAGPADRVADEARANAPTSALASAEGIVRRHYETAVGKQLATTLPDGSAITLNTDTALDVVYAAHERLVVLVRGEALFNVAHDAARPFRVRAGSRLVQAVGTVFNVWRPSDDVVEVTVSQGRVKVLERHPENEAGAAGTVRPPRELTLSAGELAVLDEVSTQVRHLEAAQIEARQAWQHGMLIYQGETLDTVLADVSRYTTVRFVVADASIRSKRVGGIFHAGDIEGFLLALRESFGIETRREGDVIVLKSRH